MLRQRGRLRLRFLIKSVQKAKTISLRRRFARSKAERFKSMIFAEANQQSL
jgi:hypothetical protein